MGISVEKMKDIYGVTLLSQLPDTEMTPEKGTEEYKEAEQYDMLVDLVAFFDSDAAEYMIKEAPISLLSFNWSGDLMEAFLWEETKQDYEYWADVYVQLMEITL